MNNGSTDNTEEILREKISQYDNLLYWGRYDGLFRDGLRALLYLDNVELFSEGDWIVRLDADEFFIDNPRDFLSKVPLSVSHVKSASFQYYYTEKDHAQEISSGDYLSVPPHKRLKYYSCNWSEYRCVRIKKDFKWTLGEKMGTNECWPTYSEYHIFSERIRLKHYKYRSLEQIKKRVKVRVEVFNRTRQFPHEGNNTIDDRIYKSESMNFDDGISGLIFDYRKLPPLISENDKAKGNYFLV